MKEKILKEALDWFEQHYDKNNIFLENFIDIVVDKTSNVLFEKVNNDFKEEFEKGNLKYPFIISNNYYFLSPRLNDIKNKCNTKNLDIYTKKFD
jgi:hypothetical protein